MKMFSTINTKREGAFIIARNEAEAKELAFQFKIVRAEKNVVLHEHQMDNHSNIQDLLNGNIVGWVALEGGRWGFKPQAHQIVGVLGAHEYRHVHSKVTCLRLTAKQKATGRFDFRNPY